MAQARAPRQLGLQRSALAGRGYRFLENKYYLDHLYENVIVDGIRGPIARASYWVNQHVIDGIVNGAGRDAVRAGSFMYNTVDQRVVDGVTGAALLAIAILANSRPELKKKLRDFRAEQETKIRATKLD